MIQSEYKYKTYSRRACL